MPTVIVQSIVYVCSGEQHQHQCMCIACSAAWRWLLNAPVLHDSVFQYFSSVGQSQHFQVVLERLSFQVLQARITYPQALPTGFDFEVVFFNAGNKIHTVTGGTGVSEQVVLISLDNVDTLSSVTARMEFVYSEDRFEGPEVTASIPPYCKL